MASETKLILDGILGSLFTFCRHERFNSLYEKSLRLFMDISPHRSIEEIEWNEQDQKNFRMWFCFEVQDDNGQSIAEIWLDENPDLYGKTDAVTRTLCRSNLAVYYIVREKSDYEKLTLRDMFSKDEISIWEPVLYQLRFKPLVFGLRVVEAGGRKFSAGDLYVFPSEISEDIFDFFHRHLQGYYGEEIEKPTGFPRGAGYLLQHLRLTLQRSDALQREMDRIRKAREKEIIKKVICHFWVEDYETIISRLQELPNLTFLGEQSGYRFYEWFEDPLLAGKDDADAGIVLTRRKLAVHCINIKCAEKIKDRLNEQLKDSATHIYDTILKKKT